ncbi:MAG: M3 family oligoendopeptidase [Candidatus Woesearchaeota archaeon]
MNNITIDKLFKTELANTDMTLTNKDKSKKNSKNIGDIWDLEELLAGKTFDEWIKVINLKVEKFKQYRSILTDNITPQKILEIIQLEEEITQDASRINSYYSLKATENTQDSEALTKVNQLTNTNAEINNDTMFFGLWFIQLNDTIANPLIASKELKSYKYYLESMRRLKPYTKTEEIEQIMELKDVTGEDAHSGIYDIITGKYTFKWDKKTITKEEVMKFVREENTKNRAKAYKLVLTKYKDDSIILSELYKNIVNGWYNDGVKIRKYPNSIAIRNKRYDVSDKAVEALLDTIKKNNEIFQEYFKIKYELNKKAGQKYPFSRYHLYAPVIIQNKKKYDYDSSKSYVLDMFKQFDVRFYDRAMRIFNAKHVHSHPKQNKRGGAFCSDVMKGIEPYILLNHTDGLRDMFVLAHEFGHGIHDSFATEKQSNAERHASLTICETASVFSEMMLANKLLTDSKNNEEKKQVLVELLDNQYGTITRQAYFVIFEKYAHEQIPKGITKEKLDEYYLGLLKEQFGKMKVPEVFKHEWNYIPHIHNSPFYCYSYAWGNLFVLALYDMYKKEGNTFKEKYINLLSAGGSDSPANLMKKLGIDPEDKTFWQRGFNIIKEEIEELKKLS